VSRNHEFIEDEDSHHRGEIATRIISTARELDIETYCIYTSSDASHTFGSTQSVQLASPASFLDISELVSIVKKHKEECQVPVLPALKIPTSDIEEVRKFATSVGYPIIIKAVDGGGGRGIRIITKDEDLSSLGKRALQESPSGKVFAEKAAVDGYRHVEVQIIGDGRGNVRHLWERECSIQRRFQKVVEFAPSSIRDRGLVGEVINAALRMAKKVCWLIIVRLYADRQRSIILPWERLSFLFERHHQNSFS